MGALQKTCQGLTVDWFQQRNACSTSSSHGRMCSRTLKVGSGGGLLLVLPPICGTGRGFRCSQTALRVSVTWGVTLVSQCLRFRKGDEQWGERYLWLDSVSLVLYMCMLWNNCLPLYSRLFITSVVCVLWNLLSLCSQSNKWVTVAESDILKKKKKICIYNRRKVSSPIHGEKVCRTLSLCVKCISLICFGWYRELNFICLITAVGNCFMVEGGCAICSDQGLTE